MMKKTIALLIFFVSACALGPKDTSLDARMAQFKNTKLKTQKSVEVLWNAYGVPRVEAQTDEDLFYTVGALQMHLRRAQLEFMRMISQGRVSEMIGSSTKDVDHFLRAMNFPELAKKNWDSLSKESKRALEEMARGMNDYVLQNPQRPVDLRLSGVQTHEWTALDLATIHKFISIDINWMMLARVLPFVEKPYYQKLWASWLGQGSFLQLLLQDFDSLQSGTEPTTSKKKGRAVTQGQPRDVKPNGADKDQRFLDQLAQAYTRAGSNAFAVGKNKTGGGASVLSSDPHLGIMIPNMWVFMVLKSPTYQSMGFLMPSFPLPAVGRNAHIAWGGTNMWSLSTHLVQVSEEELGAVTERTEHIRVRWGRDQKVKVRTISDRPIITDIPMFSYPQPLSLYWVGSEATDEALAFLKVNRAQNWQEFQSAFESYAASGQNFVYADVKGNVGQLAAFRQLQLDQKFQVPLPQFVARKEFKNVKDLPQIYNPKSGFVVSANEALTYKGETPISLFHAPKERVHRMSKVLSETSRVDLDAVKRLQLDTFSQSGKNLAGVILTLLKGQGEEVINHEAYLALKNWDGYYTQESQGALVFEVLSARLMEAYWQSLTKRMADDEESLQSLYKLYTRSTLWRGDLEKALINDSSFVHQQEWITHLNVAKVRLHEYQSWGHFHPLTVAHPMSRIPLIGRRFKFYEGPYEGGNETLMKSAHTLSSTHAPVNFGAQARWMTDLSSEDANYFVLLGGQDGWLHSPNTNDQTALWLKGQYIHVPFSKEAFVRASTQ